MPKPIRIEYMNMRWKSHIWIDREFFTTDIYQNVSRFLDELSFPSDGYNIYTETSGQTVKWKGKNQLGTSWRNTAIHEICDLLYATTADVPFACIVYKLTNDATIHVSKIGDIHANLFIGKHIELGLTHIERKYKYSCPAGRNSIIRFDKVIVDEFKYHIRTGNDQSNRYWIICLIKDNDDIN